MKGEEIKEEGQEMAGFGAGTGMATGLVPRQNITYGETKSREKKSIEKLKELGFAYIGQSQLTLWHRPTHNQVKLLQELLGITMIVTVQRDAEQP